MADDIDISVAVSAIGLLKLLLRYILLLSVRARGGGGGCCWYMLSKAAYRRYLLAYGSFVLLVHLSMEVILAPKFRHSQVAPSNLPLYVYLVQHTLLI